MSDGGATVALLQVLTWYFGVLAALYVPLLVLKAICLWTGDDYWLANKLFGKD